MKLLYCIMDNMYQWAKEILLPSSNIMNPSYMSLKIDKKHGTVPSFKCDSHTVPTYQRLNSTGEVISSDDFAGCEMNKNLKMSDRHSKTSTQPIPSKKNNSSIFGNHNFFSYQSHQLAQSRNNLQNNCHRCFYDLWSKNFDMSEAEQYLIMSGKYCNTSLTLPHQSFDHCCRKKETSYNKAAQPTVHKMSGIQASVFGNFPQVQMPRDRVDDVQLWHTQNNISGDVYKCDISKKEQNKFHVNISPGQAEKSSLDRNRIEKSSTVGVKHFNLDMSSEVFKREYLDKVDTTEKISNQKLGNSPKQIMKSQEVKMSGCVQVVTTIHSSGTVNGKSHSHEVPSTGAVHITFTPPQQTYKMYKKKQKNRPSAKKRRRAAANKNKDTKKEPGHESDNSENDQTSSHTPINMNKSGDSTGKFREQTNKQSASPVNRFHVVFEQLSSDSHSSSFESLLVESPKGSKLSPKFSFLITGADSDTSDSESDSEEDEGFDDAGKLWESFENSRQDPFSFSFSCSINSNSRTDDHVTTKDNISCSSPTPSSPLSSSPETQSNKQLVEEANLRWQEHYKTPPTTPEINQKQGRVKFAEGKSLETVKPMLAWRYAYAAARKGPWEEYARDRDRFKNRIIQVESSIGYVFQHDHREMIYKRLNDL